MTIIGHQQARTALERHLPPATLLRGPASIGKWTLTHHLAAHHQVAMADRLLYPDGLNIDAVRRITTFAATAGFGQFKLVTARLDTITPAAAAALLKLLEEPPGAATRFLFTTATTTPDTLASRCAHYPLARLTPAELADVLTTCYGYPPPAAHRAAATGTGQVRPALAADPQAAARALVLSAVNAVAAADATGLDRALRQWSPSASTLLTTYLIEALTRRPATFTTAETTTVNRSTLWNLALAVSRLPAASPHLAVRAVLQPLLTRTPSPS